MLIALSGRRGAHVALLSELASDAPLATRLVQLRAQPDGPHGRACQIQIRCAVLASLAGEPQQAEVALMRARGSAPPGADYLLELAWALIMIETARPARAVVHLERARRALEPGSDPADLSILQLLHAQALLPEMGFVNARGLAAGALRALAGDLATAPAGVYGHLIAANLALAADDHAAAASHAAHIAVALGRTGLIAGRADVLQARLHFAQTRDPAAAGLLLDRAIERFGRIGAPRDLGLAYVVRAMHSAADPADSPAKWVSRAEPLLARLGGAIDLQLVRRSPPPRQMPGVNTEVTAVMEKLRDRRARLHEVVSTRCESEGCRPCSVPLPCAGYQAIDDVLEVAAGAEEQLVAALERTMRDRTMVAQLAAATQEIATIEKDGELIAAIPELALLVCPGAAAALLQVGADGSVQVLASCGAPFEAPQSRIDEEARAAAREATLKTPNECACSGDAEPGSRRTGRTAMIPLAHGAESVVLVLERAAASPCLSEQEIEHLAVYASLAGTALARARAAAALHEAAARDAATLGAIRDGVIAIDRDGSVRALNQAAATALGLRRQDLLGRRLREVPGLAALGLALAGAPSQEMDVVSLPRGDVVVRSQAYDGGVVATLRDSATEHTIAHRMVGSVARFTFDHLVGAAPAFLRVMEDAKRAARSDVPVLICGESGTGKELLAQAIHNASPRTSGTFLGINVTAIPRELLESELFGYEGGTFTGARASGRAGKFELAGAGTLLLDEIGDMPLEMQSKLLRVLQEKLVQRLGGARDVQVRARIIATSHRDLAEAVTQGRFRLDLFHRLRVLQLRLPPLRERKEDVPLLVEHQLRLHAERTRHRVRIAPQVLSALQAYDWPGNVRELLNVIEGELSVLPSGEDLLTRIPAVLLQARTPSRPAPGTSPEVLPLAEVEHRACEEALAIFNGNVARAAPALGVAKSTLYSKMKLYGIGTPAPRRRSQASGAGLEPPSPVRLLTH